MHAAMWWATEQDGNMEVKHVVNSNISSGLYMGFIINDEHQQFYKWTVVTCIYCGRNRWSPCCTRFCRHVSDLVLILCLFWKLFIGRQAVIIRSSIWIFCYVLKSNQVWMFQDIVKPEISSLVFILCFVCNPYSGCMSVIMAILVFVFLA